MRCKGNNIEASKQVKVNEVDHAGTIAHYCVKEEHELEEMCECKCGMQFKRNYK
jgi:hypothetical protein